MSILSIATISPSAGPTAGNLLVEVRGAGFPLPAGETPTVGVLVGDRPAREVRVVSSQRLTCVVPPGDAGPVDVVVLNLDTAGAPIPGEVAVAPGAFTYVPRNTPGNNVILSDIDETVRI